MLLATDPSGESTSLNVTITVTDVNEYGPYFVGNDFSVAIPEHSAIYTSVGEIPVYDGDLGSYGLSDCRLSAGRVDPWYEHIVFTLQGPATTTSSNETTENESYSRCIVKTKAPFTEDTGHDSVFK